MLNNQEIIKRTIGGILIVLGISLLFTPLISA